MIKAASIWRFTTWFLFLLMLTWLIVTGSWVLNLAQQAAHYWIGEPWGIPFVPYFNSDTLIVPLAPFHALVFRGEWLPVASMAICGWGTGALWWVTKKVARRGYRDSD